MAVITIEGIEIDVCQDGCGGIWFDQFEFKKFDNGLEDTGDKLLALIENPTVAPDLAKKRMCPRCDGQVLHVHSYSTNQAVEIDECYKCAGVFVDVGELKQIRSQFQTEEERVAVVSDVYGKILDKAAVDFVAERESKRNSSRRFANAFKFICPSAYMPGDQNGGAF